MTIKLCDQRMVATIMKSLFQANDDIKISNSWISPLNGQIQTQENKARELKSKQTTSHRRVICTSFLTREHT